jgi:hypothetical protein
MLLPATKQNPADEIDDEEQKEAFSDCEQGISSN